MLKTRNWVGVAYPESLPENWLDLLKDLHIQAFVSPLHDKDKDETGELKKPHYHIMLMYDNTTTFDNAKSDFESFGVTTLIKAVRSKKGMARYLCHMDDKDKYRYSEDDVLSLSGANYFSAIVLQDTDDNQILSVFEYIEESQEVSFYKLIQYYRLNSPITLNYLLRNSATIIAVKEFQKSLAWELNIHSYV